MQPNMQPIVGGTDMLTVLSTQTGEYPAIDAFIKTHSISTGTLFIAQVQDMFERETVANSDFTQQLISYLDVVQGFSIVIYGAPLAFTDMMVESIVSTRSYHRAITNKRTTLGAEAVKDYMYQSDDSIRCHVLSNPTMLSLYIYVLVASALFKSTSSN